MPQIVSWEYYDSSLRCKVNRETFDKMEGLAEQEVKLVIGWLRFNSLDENAFYYRQMQDCICNVIDKMADREKIAAGKGIASISNEGYTETYSVQTESQLRAEIQGCIRAWLSGTGLAGAY